MSRVASGRTACAVAMLAPAWNAWAQGVTARITPDEVLDIAVAAVFIAAGIAALALQRLRGRENAARFLTLGVFAILYGVRLGDDAMVLAGLAPGVACYVNPLITYVLPLAPFLYTRYAIGPGWMHSLTAVVVVQCTYAVVAIALDLIHHPEYAIRPNNFLMLGSFVLLTWNVAREVRRRRVDVARWMRENVDARLVAFGLAAMTLFVLNENAVEAGLVPWKWSYEPLGMLVFIACLGAALAHRLFTREVELAGIEHELDTARRIQQSILPSAPPRRRDLAIAACYEPMTAVGGDFYDFHVGDDGTVTALIADVSGHGVPAAMVASMVKVAFGAQSDRAGDPAAVLTGIREALSRSSPTRYLVTAACVAFPPACDEILYANAGHPPLLLRRGDRVTELAQAAVPLGAFRNSSYRNERISLAGPVRLVLYSDGVTEAADGEGRQFGEERLRSIVQDSQAGAAECAGAILRGVTAWRKDARPDDDVTAVVIDVLAT